MLGRESWLVNFGRITVRTAPVKGAPGPTPSPHKKELQESTPLTAPYGPWSIFWKPRIDDPLSITPYKIFGSFVLLKMIEKPSRSGYHLSRRPKCKKYVVITTVQRMMKSRSIYLRYLNTHNKHITIISFGIDKDIGTGIAFFGIARIIMTAIGGGPLDVNGDQTTAKDSL